MRVNKRVVALRSGVDFPSLPPSAPFLGCPTGPGRTGAGEPPQAAAAEPRAAPSLPRPPYPAAPPSLCPGLLPAPPLEMSAGGGRGPREEQVAGRGRRGRDAPGALCPAPGSAGQRCGGTAPGGAGLPRAAGETPAAAALGAAGMRCRCPEPETRRVLLLRGCASPRDETARN